MEPVYGALAIIIVAGISGFVTLVVSRRTNSGQIDTSEATKLWDEGTAMRLELRDEVISLKAQLATATATMSALTLEIRISREETTKAREETRYSREETRILMMQIENVHAEVKTYNALTLGALADNTETRRILALPKADRTDTEFKHIATAGERQPESDHPFISPEDLKEGEKNGRS